MRTLAGDGHASSEVRVTPILTVIIISRDANMLGIEREEPNGFVRTRLVVQKRLGFPTA